MSKIDNPTEVRKQLLANGHHPLAAIDKICILDGWPELIITEALIASWERKRRYLSTAARLDGKVQVDADVNHPVLDLIFAAWLDAFPQLFGEAVPLLERGTTASRKRSWFLRLEGDWFGVIVTRKFLAPGESDPKKAHKVEIFSGNTRLAGFVGPHSVDRAGNVLSMYVWPEDSPLDITHDQLPAATRKDCFRLGEIAEEVLEANGFTAVAGSQSGEHRGVDRWTLTEDMLFDCVDGVERTLAELKDAAAGEHGMRCSAVWHETGAVNTTRCLARTMVRKGEEDFFFIVDFDTNDRHREKAKKPAEVEDLGAALAGLKWEDNAKGPGGAKAKAVELRRTHVFCATSRTPVLPIDACSMDEGMTLTHFRAQMLPFRQLLPDPANPAKMKMVNPADIWLCDPERIDIAGQMMRPDQVRPLFRIEGRQWQNTYCPPEHLQNSGDAAPGWALIEQLIPDKPERDYFLRLLAFKLKNPWVPGPCVVMVAQDEFGTGRGTLLALLKRLFGAGYVKTPQFHMALGRSYQSQYNDWQSGSLIAFIEETGELSGQSHHAAGNDKEMALKVLVEPRMIERLIIRKGQPNRMEMVHTTIFIAQNNLDDIPVHAKDRRRFVCRNGFEREEAFWIATEKWMSDPANVAAFAQALRQVDLTGYNPYATPPMTEAKLAMIEASKSDLDRGLDIVLGHLMGKSEIFSMFHVLNGMVAVRGTYDLNYPDDETWRTVVRRIVSKRCFRVGVKDGPNDDVMIEGKRWKSYAWTRQLAEKWKTVEPAFVRIELTKAGVLSGSFGSTIGALADQLASLHTSAPDDGGKGGSDGGSK